MKIMVCFNNSDESKAGLEEAKELAAAFNGEVLVVSSIVSDKRYYPKYIEPYEQSLKEAKAYFDENKIPCKTLISYRDFDMDSGEDLVDFAQKENVDKMVIGIRSRSRVGKLLLGSKAQRILLSAHCPVIAVKKIDQSAQ